MDNPKVIILASALGLLAAILLSPLGVNFIAALLLSVVFVPWVLLSPVVGPLAVFNTGNRKTVMAMLCGNSNLPVNKVRIVAASVVLGTVTFALYAQLIGEVLLNRLFGLKTLDHSIWWYIAIGIICLTLWKLLEYTARRIQKSQPH